MCYAPLSRGTILPWPLGEHRLSHRPSGSEGRLSETVELDRSNRHTSDCRAVPDRSSGPRILSLPGPRLRGCGGPSFNSACILIRRKGFVFDIVRLFFIAINLNSRGQNEPMPIHCDCHCNGTSDVKEQTIDHARN